MKFVAIRYVRVLLASAAIATPQYGCGLIPQQLPPGESADAAPTQGNRGDASGTTTGSSSGGAFGGSDSGTPPVSADASVADAGSSDAGASDAFGGSDALSPDGSTGGGVDASEGSADATTESGSDASDAGARAAEAGPGDASRTD